MTELKKTIDSEVENEVENIEKESDKVTSPVKNNNKSIAIKINSNSLISIAMVILIIISIAQAVELGNLKEKISTGEVKAATTSTGSTGGSTTPSNLQDLPDMVGGC